jgi:hypothetical protein
MYTLNENVMMHMRRHDMDLGIKEKVAHVLDASTGLGCTCTDALVAKRAVVSIKVRNKQAAC